jgi:hypothetical protein
MMKETIQKNDATDRYFLFTSICNSEPQNPYPSVSWSFLRFGAQVDSISCPALLSAPVDIFT